jgi:hypothetical protein
VSLCSREGGMIRPSKPGVMQMSALDFQSDAMECLRMAERAESQEEGAFLVDLARAWVLLGEQLNHSASGE